MAASTSCARTGRPRSHSLTTSRFQTGLHSRDNTDLLPELRDRRDRDVGRGRTRIEPQLPDPASPGISRRGRRAIATRKRGSVPTETAHAKLDVEYTQANPRSAALFERQARVGPAG